MNKKQKDIKLFSNPESVFKLAKKFFGNYVDIELSDKPTKKYMIKNPITDEWIHFGQMGYEDFTYHKDESKRLKFRKKK